jgi:hypothetical protein
VDEIRRLREEIKALEKRRDEAELRTYLYRCAAAKTTGTTRELKLRTAGVAAKLVAELREEIAYKCAFAETLIDAARTTRAA